MALDAYFGTAQGGDGTFVFAAPQLKFGPGVLSELGVNARALDLRRIALFADPRVRDLQVYEDALSALEGVGIDVAPFTEIDVEPTDRSFKNAITFAREGAFDGFVSLGGGSTMDTCKAANLYASHPADFLDYVNAPIGGARPVPGPLRPHIACPTTFGTGSESTGIAIFDLLDMEAKTGIAHASLRPTLGLLDPHAIATLPKPVIAANGFDVFLHAVEAVTARPFGHRPAPADGITRPTTQGANPFSDLLCFEAIRLVGEHLVEAVTAPASGPETAAHLEALMYAGMLAGMGFGNAGCHVPHGMSYAVAGLVKSYQPDGWPTNHPMIPHGTSVIVNAPAVFRKMGPACPERHLKAALALGAGEETVADARTDQAGAVLAGRVIEMMRRSNMPNGLEGVGYGEEDLDILTDKAWPQKRLIDNGPVPLSRGDLRGLFEDALTYWA